jgi:hypothetical protein
MNQLVLEELVCPGEPLAAGGADVLLQTLVDLLHVSTQLVFFGKVLRAILKRKKKQTFVSKYVLQYCTRKKHQLFLAITLINWLEFASYL